MTDDNLPCWVYRSPRHQEMYLYLSEEEAFERVPDAPVVEPRGVEAHQPDVGSPVLAVAGRAVGRRIRENVRVVAALAGLAGDRHAEGPIGIFTDGERRAADVGSPTPDVQQTLSFAQSLDDQPFAGLKTVARQHAPIPMQDHHPLARRRGGGSRAGPEGNRAPDRVLRFE